jgi:acyl-CoA synthetase (AMP-forming)/AMP-acid ligase II
LLSAFEHVTGEIVAGARERRIADLTPLGESPTRRRVSPPGPPPPVAAATMSRAARLADLLRQPRPATGRIGLLAGNDGDAVAGMLGIWLSGRDCVLLDSEDDPGRLVWTADRAGLDLVVASPSLLPAAEWLELDVVGLPPVAAPSEAAAPAPRYRGLIAFVAEADGDVPLVFGPRAVRAHAAAPGGSHGGLSHVHMRALSALAGRRPPPDGGEPLVFPEAGCVLGRSPHPGAVTTEVLDRHGKPAAAGAAGELVLLGPGLADGYLGLPRLTAGRFAPCACGESGARMYRTGRPARTDADGELELLDEELRRVR